MMGVKWGIMILLFAFTACMVEHVTEENNTTQLTSDAQPVQDSLSIFVQKKYSSLKENQQSLDSQVFYYAYLGYLNLKAAGKTSSSVLTVADFSKSSIEPRMWVIDLDRDTILINTWSSHGKGSGIRHAEVFSNVVGSHQTSLGFYLTGEVYYGMNGRSLRLDGLDKEFNSNARRRYVVMHGAKYVSQDTIAAYGYLGNSEGCPAVSHEVNHQIIDWVKDGTVLFIYGASDAYHSVWINPKSAWSYLKAQHPELSAQPL